MKKDQLLQEKEVYPDDDEAIILSSSDEEKINWLTQNVDPWEDVEQFWYDTYVIRRNLYLKNPEHSVNSYFELFKSLKCQRGKEYLELDFSLLYRGVTVIDVNGWEKIRSVLITKLASTQLKNAVELSYINTLRSGDLSKEKQDFLVFYLLVHLLPTKRKGRKRKQKPGEEENSVIPKLSLPEKRQTFILHVQDEAAIDTELQDLKTRLEKRKQTFQPVVVAVGPFVMQITSYHIAVNDQHYESGNCLETIISCLKIYFSLGCKYPEDTETIWVFLQIILLNMESNYSTVDMQVLLGLLQSRAGIEPGPNRFIVHLSTDCAI
uniref:Uncharacterized protein n=1 Tax=Trichogramma kaykai TaxID=54128 RepID=A0ABD2WAK7_9HYME